MKRFAPLLSIQLLLFWNPMGLDGQSPTDARMNQVRVLGSHNSYKQAIDASLLELLRRKSGERVEGLEYSHLPIEQQLDRGLRALEIDVVNDPKGGLYAHPKGLDWEKQNHLAPEPVYDPQGLMNRPGLKVMHIPDIDFRANVYTFQQELALLKTWSDAHPRHLPIAVTMNAKDDPPEDSSFVVPAPFDAAALDAWDAEILKGLGRNRLITPDDVRGKHPDLETAVLAHDWPKLEEARGKFLFVLDEEDQKRNLYIAGHPSLRGRAMFVNAHEGSPEAAFRIVNEPQKDWPYIQYNYSRWQAALISGAQIISTDYYVPDPALNTGYHVTLPGRARGLWDPLLLPVIRPLPPLE
jgi:calcium-dependent phosphoinositide phospholipase C